MNGDRRTRVATAAVVVTVAAFAAIVSYSHIFDLGREHGQSGVAARLLPLSVDGLILAGSLIVLHEARRGEKGPGLAWLSVWLGVGMTVSANVLYGVRYGVLGAVLSGWPAVAFIVATHALFDLLKRAGDQLGRVDTKSPPTVPPDAQTAALAALRATLAAGNPLSGRQLETRFGLSRADVTKVRELAAAQDQLGIDPDERDSKSISPQSNGHQPAE